MIQEFTQTDVAGKAWIVLGCLVAFGLAVLIVKEVPAIRRELRLMRM
jgi:hypothetical protein